MCFYILEIDHGQIHTADHCCLMISKHLRGAGEVELSMHVHHILKEKLHGSIHTMAVW